MRDFFAVSELTARKSKYVQVLWKTNGYRTKSSLYELAINKLNIHQGEVFPGYVIGERIWVNYFFIIIVSKLIIVFNN